MLLLLILPFRIIDLVAIVTGKANYLSCSSNLAV
jgi:hypothetical protein